MFNLIPAAYAATITNTASKAKEVAETHGEAGISRMVTYVTNNIDNWIAGVVLLVVFYVLAKLGAREAREAILKSRGEEIQESVLALVGRITFATIIFIGIAIAFTINGFNFTAIIGALSLGIGFALKDIIGNFISGVIILSQDRIRIGDFIKVGDILGTIVSIDTRATILQAIDGTEVVIPNQSMINQTLISFTTNPYRRIDLVVGVQYSTDLPKAVSLIKSVIRHYDDIVRKPEPIVVIDEFSDSSINIKVFFWIESSKNWMLIRSNLGSRIKKAFDKVGITIPFPIRTLKLDQDDREFLKTIDSLKKGIVPEDPAPKTDEQMKVAAKETQNEPLIPYDLTEEKTTSESEASAESEEKPKQEEALPTGQAGAEPPPKHL